VRPRRSCLAVPAPNRGMIEKAAGLEADQVILDLEDACPPSEKRDARMAIADALRTIEFGAKLRAVRVNDVTTPWCYGDIVEVVQAAGSHLDVIAVPKVEHVSQVWFVDHLLSGLERDVGLEHEIRLDLMIETAAGARDLPAIAQAARRVDALVFGPGDYAASLGIPQAHIGEIEPSYPAHQWHWVMSQIAACAHSIGVQPIDGAYGDLGNASGFREVAVQAKLLGFTGKWCIHPNQVPSANQVFTPTAPEVEAARRLVQAYDEAIRAGRGAIRLEGALVDEASRKLAQATLARAGAVTSSD
jgi:citrate lyase subunit beta/citryl-CoA lyase